MAVKVTNRQIQRFSLPPLYGKDQARAIAKAAAKKSVAARKKNEDELQKRLAEEYVEEKIYGNKYFSEDDRRRFREYLINRSKERTKKDIKKIKGDYWITEKK